MSTELSGIGGKLSGIQLCFPLSWAHSSEESEIPTPSQPCQFLGGSRMISAACKHYLQLLCKQLPSSGQLVLPLFALAAFLSLSPWLTLLIRNLSPNCTWALLGPGAGNTTLPINPSFLVTITASGLNLRTPGSLGPEWGLEVLLQERVATFRLSLLHPQEGASRQLLQPG